MVLMRAVPRWGRRMLSGKEWAADFKHAAIGIAAMDVSEVSYEESAERLRGLLRKGLLKHTDIETEPERFFLAHRMLAAHATKLGPGFWIRFTVHYNLCAGSVVALGNKEQIESLTQMQDEGLLGCFCLTEKLAGVSSGLVVNTESVWDPATETFTIRSKDQGAVKNWISQGLVADKAVIIADLIVAGKHHGPHAFFTNLREGSKVVAGVVHGDMGKKTVGNDLDNAWIAFDGLKVPKSALLNRYADVVGDEYVQKEKGMPMFHMIGQRLFTGRVAVAQAALEFRRSLFDQTKKFADSKECWSPKGGAVLSQFPKLRRIFKENEQNQARLDSFVQKCEAELCEVLRSKGAPSLELVQAIAVAKVKAVDDSIDFVHALRNAVGSYALMHGTGFEQSDFLTCCKFAEGDSSVLKLKMARDALKLHASQKPLPPSVAALCSSFSPDKDAEGFLIEAIADAIIEHTISNMA